MMSYFFHSMFFGAGGGYNGVGVGCWNPAEYSEPGSFRGGDALVLVHFVGTDVPMNIPEGPAFIRNLLQNRERAPVVLAPTSITKHTGTGWNLEGCEIAFGRCGIVGDYWKELVVEFDFGEQEVTVTGVGTDSGEDLPVKVEVCMRGMDSWYEVNLGSPGRSYDLRMSSSTDALRRTIVLDGLEKVRCTWAETDLHKTHGLSTARGGGGIHCEVIGIPRVPAGTSIMLPDGTLVGRVSADGSGGRQHGQRLPMV